MKQIQTLHAKNYSIVQDQDYFCFGIDAVLLANYAKASPKEKVMDLCTGNAIIPLLLNAKEPSLDIYAMEVQRIIFDFAKESVELNGLTEKIHVINDDLKNAFVHFEKNTFDVVTVNPPYMIDDAGKGNSNDCKTIARHEILCTLDDVIAAASGLLHSKGRLYMIHKPFRLAEIFSTLQKHKLEPKAMQLVYPSINKEPTMVLIEAVKGARSRIKIAPPLITYGADGNYTEEIKRIYKSHTFTAL